MDSSKDKIWITGASSGIGKSLSLVFAKNDYSVYATSRDEDKLSKLYDAVDRKEKLKITSLDISSYQSVFNFVDQTFADEGIDCLINNAGITSFKKTEHNSINEIDGIIQTNLLGAIYATNAVLPLMLKQQRGTIINILSVVTEKVFLQSSLYSASKAGLKAFSKVLREEVREKNIRVINIYPGATETEIWSEKSREKFAHRMMKPDEVAEIILSLYKQPWNMVTEEIVLRPILGDL
ncbi:MAG: SDR family oxidoreductase [Ignavibacteriaceae bacterium]|jgi:short-subunit dehydrogenase